MQSHNQPLHTLLGQRQYWAPLLAPSLHQEQSTCQDVDCYSQATPREDNNSAALAFRCYFMTYIHRLSVCKRSEQRQSVDWESWLPFVRGAVQLKSLFLFWITEVWLIEIAFSPLPTSAWWVQGTNKLLERSAGLKGCGRSLEAMCMSCRCGSSKSTSQCRAKSALYLYQNEELDLSQSRWNARLLLLNLTFWMRKSWVENADETLL